MPKDYEPKTRIKFIIISRKDILIISITYYSYYSCLLPDDEYMKKFIRGRLYLKTK